MLLTSSHRGMGVTPWCFRNFLREKPTWRFRLAVAVVINHALPSLGMILLTYRHLQRMPLWIFGDLGSRYETSRCFMRSCKLGDGHFGQRYIETNLYPKQLPILCFFCKCSRCEFVHIWFFTACFQANQISFSQTRCFFVQIRVFPPWKGIRNLPYCIWFS